MIMCWHNRKSNSNDNKMNDDSTINTNAHAAIINCINGTNNNNALIYFKE